MIKINNLNFELYLEELEISRFSNIRYQNNFSKKFNIIKNDNFNFLKEFAVRNLYLNYNDSDLKNDFEKETNNNKDKYLKKYKRFIYKKKHKK